jgi:hypothetical protein
MTELDGLDSKTTTVLGAAGVLIGLIANAVRDFDPPAPPPARLVLYGAFVILLAAIGAGVWNLWPLRPSLVPDPVHLLKQYADKGATETRGVLAATRAEAFNGNLTLVRGKARLLRAQLILLLAGAACVAGAFLFRAMG